MGGTMGGAPKHAKPGSSRWQPNKPGQPGQPSQPHYGGPTPPPGWTYPGQQQGPNPQQQGPNPGQNQGQVRGGVDKQEAPTEEIGFRLPEHEQPDHPEEK